MPAAIIYRPSLDCMSFEDETGMEKSCSSSMRRRMDVSLLERLRLAREEIHSGRVGPVLRA